MAPSVPSPPEEDPLSTVEVCVAGAVVHCDLTPSSYDLRLGVEHVSDL